MLSEKELTAFREKLISLSEEKDFSCEADALCFLDKAVSVLEKESKALRPFDRCGRPGGLLDFRKKNTPAVIVPDIHGRTDFLLKLLSFNLSRTSLKKNETVLEALNRKSLIVVCVGDGIHCEHRAMVRWQKSLEFYKKGIVDSEPMKDEMRENISTMKIVMELKNSFSENFHFLKGNHENILNENSYGNHAFYKYALEGEMTRAFMEKVFGDAVIYLIDSWEKNLPLCAAFSSFCVSHSEPALFFKKRELVNFRENPFITESLTWTGNDQAEDKSVCRLFHELTGKKESSALWFAGHRPVEGKFFYRQNASLIQFHNPEEMNCVFFNFDKKFNPEEDIISVDTERWGGEAGSGASGACGGQKGNVEVMEDNVPLEQCGVFEKYSGRKST